MVFLKHCGSTIAVMGKYTSGLTSRDWRREVRKRRFRILANVGLAALAAATAAVVWMALGR